MDTHMTPFKRRFVDNWRKEVNKHLRAGTICKIVTESLHGVIGKDIKDGTSAVHEIATQTSPRISNDVQQTKARFSNSLAENQAVEQNNRKENLHEEGKSNVVRKSGHRHFYYQRNDRKTGEKDRCDDEPTPLVIIDPQLITPVRNYTIDSKETISRQNPINNRPKTSERIIHNPFKFQSYQPTQESSQQNKEVWSIRCQVQSRDKNSFVVSRSNLTKCNGVTNHSVFNLPARFQTEKQNIQQTTPGVSIEKPAKMNFSKRSHTSTYAIQAWV